MSGIFEHLAAFDDSERVAGRQAVAVARKRVEDRFGPFLANATGEADRTARLALIEDDLDQIISSVVDEYGGDAAKVREVIADWTKLPRGDKGQWTKAEQLQESDKSDIDSELDEAPSAVGANSGEGVLSSHTAGHAADCSCGFCENKGGFGKKDEDEDEEDDEKTARRTAADPPEGAGGAVKREDLPKADPSGLGGPSPKIDKGKSGDQNGWNLKPIDTEMKGSPEPVRQQDISQKPEKDKADFLDQTDSVTTQEELPTNLDDAGWDDGGVNHGDNTDTWTEVQNDPVTSDKGEGVLAATDPDRNPIADIMSKWEEEKSAIAEFEGES